MGTSYFRLGDVPERVAAVPKSTAVVGDRRVDFVDMLRAIAALAVVVQHTFEISIKPWMHKVCIVSPGVFGVALFFVISGFVMPISVRRGLDLKDFALRRVMRIYPLLLVAFAIKALLMATGVSADPPASGAAWLANVLLLQDMVRQPALIGVTWTLLIEFCWYALFAVTWHVSGARGIERLAVMAPVVLVGLALVSLAIGVRFPMGRIGFFYIAILGARLSQAYFGGVAPRRIQIECAVFLVVVTFTNWVAFGHFHHPRISLAAAAVPWVVAPLLFMAVLAWQMRGGAARSLPGGRWLGVLGVTSYSIYLLHPLAMDMLHSLPQTLPVTAAIWVLTGVMATLAYRLVEKPGISAGRWLAGRIAGR